MIYVTHDQVEAMTMGDRIVVMKDGRIQQVDDPISLYDRPLNMFVAGFIGSPPMNFSRGTLQPRERGLWFVENAGEGGRKAGFSTRLEPAMADKLASRSGQAIVFGIRPECIQHLDTETDPGRVIAATVEVVEPMGAEIYLSLASASHTFVARVQAHDKSAVSERIQLTLDMRKCHFFDPQSEETIA
jgi:multiple sugar transport system ATP-binding protein